MLFRDDDISRHRSSHRSLRSFWRFNFGLLWLIVGSDRPVEKREDDDQTAIIQANSPALFSHFYFIISQSGVRATKYRSIYAHRVKRPEKITLTEMRAAGVRGLLIYCSDFRCSH
jgi:hypothetical protein